MHARLRNDRGAVVNVNGVGRRCVIARNARRSAAAAAEGVVLGVMSRSCDTHYYHYAYVLSSIIVCVVQRLNTAHPTADRRTSRKRKKKPYGLCNNGPHSSTG